jgi:hypothetical protein
MSTTSSNLKPQTEQAVEAEKPGPDLTYILKGKKLAVVFVAMLLSLLLVALEYVPPDFRFLESIAKLTHLRALVVKQFSRLYVSYSRARLTSARADRFDANRHFLESLPISMLSTCKVGSLRRSSSLKPRSSSSTAKSSESTPPSGRY